MIQESRRVSWRLANSQADLDLLRPVSQEFHSEGRFRDIPYSFQKRDALLSRALNDPDRNALMIAECGQDPMGFLFCSIGEYMVGTDDLLTTVTSFWKSNTVGEPDSSIGRRGQLNRLFRLESFF